MFRFNKKFNVYFQIFPSWNFCCFHCSVSAIFVANKASSPFQAPARETEDHSRVFCSHSRNLDTKMISLSIYFFIILSHPEFFRRMQSIFPCFTCERQQVLCCLLALTIFLHLSPHSIYFIFPLYLIDYLVITFIPLCCHIQ